MEKFAVLLLTLVSVGFASEPDLPTVTICQGSLVGTTITTRGGRDICGFMGIPYAAPPIGPLRFKSPQEPPTWQGVRNASEPGNVCIQRSMLTEALDKTIYGSEDCLFLNVYTPQISPVKKLPVMFFIHGGSFIASSGNPEEYGPELLLDRDMVLVTINYRLGPFGFLSTGDSVLPGNLGLKDQLAALKWVQKNIEHFGGDKNSVTIFGESAGGASVHFHMLSPRSQGLFHRGISESGTALCPWAYSTAARHYDLTSKLAKLTGCPLTPSQQLVDCLRNVPAHDIIEKLKYFIVWDSEPLVLFNPTTESKDVEDAFLVSDPWTLTSNIPWMVGFNEDEGSFKAAILTLGNKVEKFNKLNEFFYAICPMSMIIQYTADNPIKICEAIRNVYFRNKNITEAMIPDIVKLYTDSWAAFGTIEAINRHNGSIFPYYFTYHNSNNVSTCNYYFNNSLYMGVCHADELLYLFPMTGHAPKEIEGNPDFEISKKMIQLWTNYAKESVPELDGGISFWKNNYGSKTNYLEISDDSIGLIAQPLKDRMSFWRALPLRRNCARDECKHCSL